jgi:tetratricopeptide (TPR) repeat protein
LRKPVLLSGILFASFAGLWAFPPQTVDPARQDLALGRADEALQVLDATLTREPGSAEAHNLRCRVYYQEEQWDSAIADCEAAVRLAPDDSNFHLWLGRACGQKAAHVSKLSAYKLARKVDAEFRKAVELDPQNAAALADLGEFDVRAPGVVGGGVDRAEAVLQQLRPVSPASALNLQAGIAEAHRDYPAAEADLRAAIPLAASPADAWMDLASFYRRHDRLDDMLTAVHTGASLDPGHGPALVDGASNLVLARREPDTAILWLQQYLSSGAQAETAPVFVVRAQLAQLLRRRGDLEGAQQQIDAAHALASAYRIPSLHASAKEAGL